MKEGTSQAKAALERVMTKVNTSVLQNHFEKNKQSRVKGPGIEEGKLKKYEIA